MIVRKSFQRFVGSTIVVCVGKFSARNAVVKWCREKLSIVLVSYSKVFRVFLWTFYNLFCLPDEVFESIHYHSLFIPLGDLKVCTYCSKIVLTHLKTLDMNSESDLQALQNDLANKFQLQSGSTLSINDHDISTAHRKISVGYQEERLLSQSKYLLSNADRKNILQQSETLKTLYDDMAKALPYQNHGSDLISYLIGKNKSSNRSQALAMLTAMLEAGYVTEIDGIGPNAAPIKLNANNPFGSGVGGGGSSDNDSNNYWSSDTDIIHEFNENGMYKLLRVNEIMTNSGTFQLNVDVDSSSVFVSKPDGSLTGQAHVIRNVFKCVKNYGGRFTGVDGIGGKRESNFSLAEIGTMDLDDSVVSATGSKCLQEAYCRHEEHLLCKIDGNCKREQDLLEQFLIPNILRGSSQRKSLEFVEFLQCSLKFWKRVRTSLNFSISSIFSSTSTQRKSRRVMVEDLDPVMCASGKYNIARYT